MKEALHLRKTTTWSYPHEKIHSIDRKNNSAGARNKYRCITEAGLYEPVLSLAAALEALSHFLSSLQFWKCSPYVYAVQRWGAGGKSNQLGSSFVLEAC